MVELLRVSKSAFKAQETIFSRGATLIILTKDETRRDEKSSLSPIVK